MDLMPPIEFSNTNEKACLNLCLVHPLIKIQHHFDHLNTKKAQSLYINNEIVISNKKSYNLCRI